MGIGSGLMQCVGEAQDTDAGIRQGAIYGGKQRGKTGHVREWFTPQKPRKKGSDDGLGSISLWG